MDQLFAYAVLVILGLLGLSLATVLITACAVACYGLFALWMWRS